MRGRRRKYLLLLPVCALTIGTFSFSKNLKVSRVECYTQFGICPDQYQSIAANLIGKPVLRPLPEDQILSEVKKFEQIRSFQIYRRLPSTAILTLTLRSPLGQVTSVLGASTVVDTEGKVLPIEANNSQPTLIIENWSPDQTLDANHLSALRILNKLSKTLSPKITGNLTGLTLTVTSESHPKILIDISRSVESWSAPLQSILNRSKIGSNRVQTIDVRYNQPVLIY